MNIDQLVKQNIKKKPLYSRKACDYAGFLFIYLLLKVFEAFYKRYFFRLSSKYFVILVIK